MKRGRKRLGLVTKRVQFDFSEGFIERLDGIVIDTDAASRAEVVRHSLELYEHVVKLRAQGGIFLFRDAAGGEREVVILGT